MESICNEYTEYHDSGEKYFQIIKFIDIHRPQKVYERFRLPPVRPLRCDYFNKSLSENPCM